MICWKKAVELEQHALAALRLGQEYEYINDFVMAGIHHINFSMSMTLAGKWHT